MPKILGMEPEQYKPLLLVGGGGLVLFFLLRGNSSGGGGAIAASPPTEGFPSYGVAPPSAGAEMSDTQRQAEALHLQMEQHQFEHQEASDALHLQSEALALRVSGAQASAAESYFRQTAKLPIRCPEGKVRIGIDGQPFCYTKSGKAGFFKPLANAVNKLVNFSANAGEQAAEMYIGAQLGQVALPGGGTISQRPSGTPPIAARKPAPPAYDPRRIQQASVLWCDPGEC